MLKMKSTQLEFGIGSLTLHEKWIRIQRDTPYLSVFSPNAGKYGPENTDHFSGSMIFSRLDYCNDLFAGLP